MAHKKHTRRQQTVSLLITGGGAERYVYPGIAVAQEVLRRCPTADIVFAGTPRGGDADIVLQAGFRFEALDVQEPGNRQHAMNFSLLRQLPQAIWAAMKILKRRRPGMVLGTGGYVSVPLLYAAYVLRIPTMILETNRQPALANRLLSRSVDTIAVEFEASAAFFPAKKVIVTGHPVRREFFVIGGTPPPDKGSRSNVLVLSGGLGARSINYTAIAALEYLQAHRDHLTFTHQSGGADFEYVNAGYAERGFKAEVLRYIDDLPRIYAKSHLIIGRAGANMIAEIKASGRSAIVIPYPRDDQDQESNALALRDSGLAQVILQKELSGTTLSQAIRQVLEHPEESAQVWPNGKRQEAQDATARIAEACLNLSLGQSPHALDF